MNFYLGTHMPHWLASAEFPLFVSHRTLGKRKTMPKAIVNWALDSGGFTELSMFGEWTVEPQAYVDAVERYVDEVGMLDWAAPQDWMCEPWILEKTGLTVREHQERTVFNFLVLRELAPHLPIAPVIQGWTLGDYITCVGLYEQNGVDLRVEKIVGLGSVCRRQSTEEIEDIATTLFNAGLKLHGFGVKTRGLKLYGRFLESADSLAWSYSGRYSAPLRDCSHKNCANCYAYAKLWRERVLRGAERQQLRLSFA